MITILLILLLTGIILFTHFVVNYLIENNIRILAIMFTFAGVITSIFIVNFIMGNLVEFVTSQLEIFYRD